jgi:hypothetical protein
MNMLHRLSHGSLRIDPEDLFLYRRYGASTGRSIVDQSLSSLVYLDLQIQASSVFVSMSTVVDRFCLGYRQISLIGIETPSFAFVHSLLFPSSQNGAANWPDRELAPPRSSRAIAALPKRR